MTFLPPAAGETRRESSEARRGDFRLSGHWPEYLMEAAGLGSFMLSACLLGTLLEHPGSPVRQAIADPFPRRILMGIAMGLTATAIIYSPWGKRSGAHINPSVTLTFLRLGRVHPADALFYVVFQFAGATAGVALAAALLGAALADPSVNYVVTTPGAWGVGVALGAEVLISFGMMAVVLNSTSRPRLAPFTGLFAGALVAMYISLEAPLSGMSMNPARTLGSAAAVGHWQALWIYFTAPLAGMLLAAEAHVRRQGPHPDACAKLHHDNPLRCIFCEYRQRRDLSATGREPCRQTVTMT